MANKHFSTDFDLIPDVKANDTFLVEDSDDGVVKKCHPSQVWQKFDDLDRSVAAAAQSASDAADAKDDAEAAQAAAEQARTDAQNASTAAGNAQTAAENAQTAAENAQTAAENAQTAAESAQSDAEDARDAAAASAVVAGEKASEAAASASSAATSADDAAASAAQASGVMLANVVQANAYGIEFYDTGSDFSVTRVAEDMNLHKPLISKGLPVQKKMRRFLMADDGTNNGYLLGSDSRYKANGAQADLSGADGQVMVELPKWAQKCWQVGTDANTGNPIYRYMMMDAAVIDAYTDGEGNNPLWDYMQEDGWNWSEKLNVAAFLMADKGSSRALGSQAGTSVCAKDRIAFLDAYGLIVRESGNIEYPNHSISDGSHRKYSSSRSANAAANLRGAAWFADLYAAQKKLNWLFVVEYATFNWQKAYNAAVDANGYRQGGMGEGFTSGLDFMGDGSGWSNNNAYAVPNGCTLGLGNESGEVDFYPSKEGQAMRRWAVNRASALPSVEVVATQNGAAGTTTADCAVSGFVIVRNTTNGSTSDVVLQNTSGAIIAAGASVDFASGGTGFTRHAASDTDYVYCIVEYGNIGVADSSVPAAGIILPVGANIFVQGYNADGTGKLFVFTEAVTADGTSSVADYITAGKLIEAIAEPSDNVKVGQLVFDYATMGDSTTARGYWRCTAAGTFGTSGTGTFVYVQDEYHYQHINSYRGVEFPFGYVWQCATDILFDKNEDGKLDVWQCVDRDYLKPVISNNSVLNYTGGYTSSMSDANRALYLDGVKWKKIGEAPADYGAYIRELGLGEDAETYPKRCGGSANTYTGDIYYSQYQIASKPVGNITVLLMGGHADLGSVAGGFTAYADYAVGSARANFGSRLCHE